MLCAAGCESPDPPPVEFKVPVASNFTWLVPGLLGVSVNPSAFVVLVIKFSAVWVVLLTPLTWATFTVLFSTNASVASFVVLSAVACVVAVVPFGKAGVPDRFAAVPVVFWFKVGKSPATAIDNTPVVVVFL